MATETDATPLSDTAILARLIRPEEDTLWSMRPSRCCVSGLSNGTWTACTIR